MNKAKLILIVVAITAFVVACGQNANTPTSNAGNKTANASTPAPSPTAAVKDEMAMAADLYTVHCMTCHKDSGKGGPVTVDGKKIDPDDITTEKQAAKSDEKILGYIADGFPDDGMPAFKDKLSDAEMVSLVKHIRKLQGK